MEPIWRILDGKVRLTVAHGGVQAIKIINQHLAPSGLVMLTEDGLLME